MSRYSVEIDPLEYDEESHEFADDLDGYTIDVLAALMKQFYQEREVSKVNKRVSIVTKEISVDGNGNGKSAAKNELDYVTSQSELLMNNLRPTAYV